VVTTAEITVDNDVILDGEGKLTVDGNGSHRVFSVAPGVTTELIGFMVTGGANSQFGGGIANYGTLRLTNSTVSANSTAQGDGSGVYNSGDLILANTIVSDNTAQLGGGGLFNVGSLELNNSAVMRNTSVNGFGGGIVSIEPPSIIVLNNSTVSDNWAKEGGGGIGTSGLAKLVGTTVSGNTSVATGGGIANAGDNGVLTLINSTVSGNAVVNAGGGGIGSNGTMTVISSTISRNTAVFGATGIWNDGSATLRNTVVDGDCQSNPAVVSFGGNIEIEGNTCGLDHPTDQVWLAAPELNLQPLGDNGGPTQTHALGAGSDAIDWIDPIECVDTAGLPLTTDQRGEPRPAGLGCDVGSFEAQP
jgi:hypothetical protein